MAIADNDEVFVAGKNLIYKLSANLSQLMNVSVSSDSSVRVRGLSVSNVGEYIVACLTTGRCIGYDVINLNATNSDVPLNEPTESVFPGDDPVVIFPGDAVGIIHTGTVVVGNSPAVYRMSLGRCKIILGSIMADTTRDYTLLRSMARFNKRVFKAGFTNDNFTYYIVEDDNSEIRILRVCSSATSIFQGLYEVQLKCDRSTIFAGASIVSNLTDTLILTVKSPNTHSTRSGRVCTYNIGDVNTAMDNGQKACAAGESREAIYSNFPSNNIINGKICANATVSSYCMYLYLCILITQVGM